ncbi:MAG: hypothetical protein KIS62_02060 [Ramlibacter sp.]|nr:hypothetical protein [Ramlibacter sp.]
MTPLFARLMALPVLVAALSASPVLAEQRTIDVQVGDRVEFERLGKLETGTVVRIVLGAPPEVAAFTALQDRDNDRFTVLVRGHKVRKLGGAANAAHVAQPSRPRAACPSMAARQGASASPDLVRALIVCTLEDNSGFYAGKTVNVDVVSFRMGRAVKNRDAPVSLRYADANATLYNATMHYNQRVYSSTEVVHFDGVERNFTVYVDLHDRWAVGMHRVSDGQMRRTALPR